MHLGATSKMKRRGRMVTLTRGQVAVDVSLSPLAIRLELTKDHPRANAVVRAAAEMADWNRKREGRGLGFAFSDYHESFSAAVAEVSVDRNTGKIKVHNYWIAVDPGLGIDRRRNDERNVLDRHGLAIAAGNLTAHVIGHASQRHVDQPAARIVRDAISRPLRSRGD